MKAKKLGSRSDTQPSHALSRYVNGSGARGPRAKSTVALPRQVQTGLFFQPVQLHLEPPDFTVEPLRVTVRRGRLGTALPLKHLAGLLQQRVFPVAHLDGMNPIFLADLVPRLRLADRFQGHFGLEVPAILILAISPVLDYGGAGSRGGEGSSRTGTTRPGSKLWSMNVIKASQFSKHRSLVKVRMSPNKRCREGSFRRSSGYWSSIHSSTVWTKKARMMRLASTDDQCCWLWP